MFLVADCLVAPLLLAGVDMASLRVVVDVDVAVLLLPLVLDCCLVVVDVLRCVVPLFTVLVDLPLWVDCLFVVAFVLLVGVVD